MEVTHIHSTDEVAAMVNTMPHTAVRTFGERERSLGSVAAIAVHGIALWYLSCG